MPEWTTIHSFISLCLASLSFQSILYLNNTKKSQTIPLKVPQDGWNSFQWHSSRNISMDVAIVDSSGEGFVVETSWNGCPSWLHFVFYISNLSYVHFSYIRRPLGEGPPGCEGSPLSCILVPLFERDHIAALIFRIFMISTWFFRIPLFLDVWCCILHVEKLLHTVWLLECGSGRGQIPRTGHSCSAPASPPGKPSKIIRFQSCFQVTKTIKIGFKAEKTKKWHRNQQNLSICEKLVFATHLTPNAWFWSPRHPDSDPEIIEKRDL